MSVWRYWCVFKVIFGYMRTNDDWCSPYFVVSQQIGNGEDGVVVVCSCSCGWVLHFSV